MDFENFLDRLTLFVKKNPELIIMTLSNIFTMRLIGNKTHEISLKSLYLNL